MEKISNKENKEAVKKYDGVILIKPSGVEKTRLI